MTMRRYGAARYAACLLASTGLAGTVALAQDAPAPAGNAPQSAAPAVRLAQGRSASRRSLEEIVVTATKRAENVQKVPISIQALSSAKLAQHQVVNLDDYIKLLPSVSYQSYGPGQTQLFFRGIATAGDGGYGTRAGSLPATGVYLDETPVTTLGNAVDIHTYDIDRVEALAGPQGTLFGASSLAGTLRIITKKPDPSKFSAAYDVQADDYGNGTPGGMTEGYVNIPLNEHAAVRLVGFYDYQGGYINNVFDQRTYTLGQSDPSIFKTVNNASQVASHFNPISTWGGRAALRADLNDDWTITPSIIYQNQIARGAFLYDPKKGDLNVSDFTADVNKDKWWQAALTIEGKIGDWNFLYNWGYFGRHVDTKADYSYYTVAYDTIPGYTNFPNGKGGYLDPSQAFSGSDDYTKQTHEMRVTSPADRPVRFLGGLFFQRQTDDALANYQIKGLSGIPSSPAVPDFPNDIFADKVTVIDLDYAAFTEAAWDILPNLTLTGGIRGFYYDNSVRGFVGFLSNTLSSNCQKTFRTDIPCTDVNKTANGAGETHRVNLAWRIDDDRMVYFTWSTGFRPGGINRRVGVNPFQPDTLTNYEVGWKTSWFNHELYFNGALYKEDWFNVQYGLPPVGSAGVVNVYNAGNARVLGVESDLTWHVTPALTLYGSGSYTDARLTTNFCSFNAAGNPDCSLGIIAAPAGTHLPIQPFFKANATARYNFEIGEYASFVQASVLHQGGTRSWLTTREANLLGPTNEFTTADFSAGFTRANWTVEAFIQNAFNDRGQLSKNTVCVPTICGFAARIYPVKPQFFGIKVGQKF